MSSNSVLKDYYAELDNATKMKADGVRQVEASVAGSDLAAGRSHVSIDEYIKKWQDGIVAMENGAPESDFNY